MWSETAKRIQGPNRALAAAVQQRLDQKTKPVGSLGRLEQLACQYVAIRGELPAEMPRKAIVVMGADHGVAEEGVSAFPQEVTAQMLLNFARGGAAINVLARHAGAQVVVVDLGVHGELPAMPEILDRRIAAGTRNLARAPAMTLAQAEQALEVGISVADGLIDRGVTLIGLGEMGIANTTAASALTAAFTGASAEEVTGRGTGIDDAAHRRKVEVVKRALALHAGAGPLELLARLGGFELAGLAGVILGAAARRVPVMLDGFITGAAALAAVQLAPAARGTLLASHLSVEVGHRHALLSLELRPLLQLDLRLGEGTGAALAMGLVDAALKILAEMATFESAGVSAAS
jgi:nicotinate-nucleotide--dimethylbenzimidazole phosphoribosyltransferase